jgi:hypothetical protein
MPYCARLITNSAVLTPICVLLMPACANINTNLCIRNTKLCLLYTNLCLFDANLCSVDANLCPIRYVKTNILQKARLFQTSQYHFYKKTIVFKHKKRAVNNSSFNIYSKNYLHHTRHSTTHATWRHHWSRLI